MSDAHVDGFEFPGFALPGAPVFNGADGGAMFAGDFVAPVAVLDLAMVFGSRVWGHEPPPHVHDAAPVLAPGVGDLFSHELRERACEALCSRVAWELDMHSSDWRALVLHTGSEAVETALKTALRASGRTRMVAFEGGYHGTFGLAAAVTHGEKFREPWAAQYATDTVRWVPWGEVPELDEDVACVVVEPWQGRAGVLEPPPGFHAAVRAECDRVGALLVLDAVLCGAGRTGVTIAELLGESRPDIVCLGKSIGCGNVASAVVARAEVAHAAWARGAVEPAHTSTALGAPAACVGVLASLDRLVSGSDQLEAACVVWRQLLEQAHDRTGLELRGLGLVWALDTGRAGGGVELAARLLAEHRVLVVPSGADGSSITLYPSTRSSDGERERVLDAIVASTAGSS